MLSTCRAFDIKFSLKAPPPAAPHSAQPARPDAPDYLAAYFKAPAGAPAQLCILSPLRDSQFPNLGGAAETDLSQPWIPH